MTTPTTPKAWRDPRLGTHREVEVSDSYTYVAEDQPARAAQLIAAWRAG
jgi:hypothetical protein